MFAADGTGEAPISKAGLLARAIPGLPLSFLGWLVAVYTDHYRLSGWIVLFGFAVLAARYLSVPARRPRDHVGTTGIMLSILMLEAYLLSVAGVKTEAFNDSAPYLIISSIYLPFPIVLLICSLFQREHDAALYIAAAIIGLVCVLLVFIDGVLVQLAFDVPRLFVEAFRTSSQTLYYDSVIFGAVVIGSLALITASFRICRLAWPAGGLMADATARGEPAI